MSDADTMKDQPSVPLMTLHSTKGLEFDNVFIVGLEQDILPHRRSLEDPGVGTDEDPVEEERRLFYVGMTRARRRLFITHADYHVTGSGGGFRVLPSDFLEELPATGVRRERAGGRSRSYGGKRRAGDLHRRQQALRREYGMDSAAPAYKLKGNRKISLTILDGNSGDRLAEGVRVSHPQFGQGTISKVEPMASRIMMKVSFDDTGPMSLLLNADDVVEAE
jgi:DNA helicase-2/ATP-dependent DNA helicase PcrA